MSATDSARAVDQIEDDDSEVFTDHKVLPVLEECIAWGVIPGTAVCGFVFTVDNDAGPAEKIGGVHVPCQPCDDWVVMATIAVDNDFLL